MFFNSRSRADDGERQRTPPRFSRPGVAFDFPTREDGGRMAFACAESRVWHLILRGRRG